MIRIELDRIHLELLLLSGLIAAFAGVVFEPTMRYGVNVIPLVALGVVWTLAIAVLAHRRFTTGNQNRIRAMVWFALLGAIVGATVSTAVVGTVRSMLLAGAGVGAMFFAVGTQFSIVVKDRESAAKEAVEAIIDENNIFVTPEQLRTNSETTGTPGFEQTVETESEPNPPSAPESDEFSDESLFERERENEPETENMWNIESDDSEPDDDLDAVDDVERTDDPGSESWSRSDSKDTGISVIRSVSTDTSDE